MPSWISAWVPIRRSTSPSARPARMRRRSAAVVRLVSSSTRSGASPAGEQVARRSGTLEALQQVADARVVLLGQHLGGRHQRPLVAALDGDQQRAHRHDGLARPDVALQQPVHRVRAGQIGVDLGDGPLLGPGQREAAGGRGTRADAGSPVDAGGGCPVWCARAPACAAPASAAPAAARRRPGAGGPPGRRPWCPGAWMSWKARSRSIRSSASRQHLGGTGSANSPARPSTSAIQRRCPSS